VLAEGTGPNGLYTVKISATVSDDLLEDELVKLIKEDRVIIFTVEQNLGGTDERRILKNKLIEKLTNAGYENLVGHEMTGSQGPPLPGDLKSADLAFARKAGLYYLADVVIAGKAASAESLKIRDNFYSAHAEGFLRVFKVHDNRYLAGVEKTMVKGFGKNPKDAGTDALENLSEEMIKTVLRELTPLQYRAVEVVFYNVPTQAEFRKYMNLLSLMRWVQKAESDSVGYNSIKSVFRVRYGENSTFLATRLDRMPELEVTSASDERIEVNVVR